jgi:hypothetical protein
VADSMYAKYLQERTDDSIIETEEGFASYRFVNGGKSVYIVDIYVLPDYRKSHVASTIAGKVVSIAKEKGCTQLLGSVCPSAKGSTTSLKVLLGYGMTLLSASQDCIFFTKDI